ncbi:MAG: acyl-CoA dehydrogenase family protein [Gemmataceae bacterium]
MSTSTQPEQEKLSFAETALRLSGKSEDEARRTGAMDQADEQVEALFKYQTAASPIHRAVWDGKTPLELFQAPALSVSHPCDEAMNKSMAIVKRRKSEGVLYDENGKVSEATLAELATVGYWGMLIDQKYGGQGAPFSRFSRFLMRMAMVDGMVSGLASVHGCIGAVDPVATFGSEEQKERFLPKLASGESLSAFALTEPNAGSDLTALRTTAELVGDHYEITGEKLFITNAVPGRTIGIVVMLDGKPAVFIAELPKEENDHFQIVPYGLYALRHGYNQGLRFNKFRVPKDNLLHSTVGDGLTIAYHGLNLGRLALCANASGTMRVMLANMLPWANFRRTYGQAIETRELVKRRIARMAGLIVGCDALVAWGSWLIEQGYRGELECMIAKIFGSEALKEAAIELFMKTHGGRSFLEGHLFAENVHDFLAPCIYEGEGEMLGMAFFKGLVKQHGKTYFEPIGKALQKHAIKNFNPANPIHAWKLRKEMYAYAKWSMGQKFKAADRQNVPGLDKRLQDHVDFTLKQFQRSPTEISDAMVKHQLKLADRQCRIAELSQRVQDNVTILVTSLYANQQKNETLVMAADILDRDLRHKLTGERYPDRYYKDASALADKIIADGFPGLEEIQPQDIMMSYSQEI